MVKSELNKRSPIRVFENSIHGGLGKGNLGVLASRHGIGKTACLVHLATDKLFRDEHVIHVSFSQNVNHVIAWYEDIFKEISQKRDLEDALDVHSEIIKNRVIMNFSQENISVDQILNSLRAMIKDGGFKANAVFFDGYRMTTVEKADVDKIKVFAQEMDIEVWFSVSPVREGVEFDAYGVPKTLDNLVDSIDVLIGLAYSGDEIALTVVKDHDEKSPKLLSIMLDPKTMLISDK